jgi:hypothetical protein
MKTAGDINRYKMLIQQGDIKSKIIIQQYTGIKRGEEQIAQHSIHNINGKNKINAINNMRKITQIIKLIMEQTNEIMK